MEVLADDRKQEMILPHFARFLAVSQLLVWICLGSKHLQWHISYVNKEK